jgi:hypothetical protein
MDDQGYSGAKALAELHERHLRSFLEEWRLAKKQGVGLPKSEDPAYRSLEALLLHVMSCASRYIGWAAEALEIPPPAPPELPGEDEIEAAADRVLEAILQTWCVPLADLPERGFVSGTHKAWWGTPYCVDAMLEHAVMHPLRHEWQLRKLSGRSTV